MKTLHTFRIVFIVLAAYIAIVLLLYWVESGHPEANLQSVVDVIWYSLVTLTTVGYGDNYPVTPLGKVLGLLFIFGSLGVLGLLIGRITERINEIKERKKMGYEGSDFKQHAIIIGWNDFARTISIQLIHAGRKVAVMTDNKDDIDLIYQEFGKENAFVLFSDLKTTAFLDKLNLDRSSMVFVNLPDDAEKLIAILNIRKVHPQSRFLVTLDNADLKDTFQSAGVTYVLSKNEIAAKLIASYIFEPDVAHFSSDLIATAREEFDYDIQQYQILPANPFAGKPYGEAFQSLKERFNIVTIGLVKVRGEERQLIKMPDNDVIVDPGDYLIMILNGRNEKDIIKLFQTTEGVA